MLTPLGSDPPNLASFVVPEVINHEWVVSYIFGAPEADDVLSHVARWGGPLFSYEFAGDNIRIAWRSDFLPDLCARLSDRLGATPSFQGIRY